MFIYFRINSFLYKLFVPMFIIFNKVNLNNVDRKTQKNEFSSNLGCDYDEEIRSVILTGKLLSTCVRMHDKSF